MQYFHVLGRTIGSVKSNTCTGIRTVAIGVGHAWFIKQSVVLRKHLYVSLNWKI